MSQTMKAAFLPGNSTVEMMTVPVPSPGHGVATGYLDLHQAPTLIRQQGKLALFSLIVMAILGGAVFTPLTSIVFQFTRSMAMTVCVPLACYFVVADDAFWVSPLVSRRVERKVSEVHFG